jgi:hypothetical protein
VVLIVTMLLSTAAVGRAQERSAPDLPVLTAIRDIRGLSQDEGQRGYPVRIRGTVTHFDEILHTTLIVHDGAFGQFVSPPAKGVNVGNWDDLKTGDLVEIEGRTVRGGFAPNVAPERIRKIGRGGMPEGKKLAFSEMLTGRYDCDYIGVVGVIQRTWLSARPSQVMYAEVATEDGMVRAAFWDSTI